MKILIALLLALNANAEICRFAAKDKDNPFARWLSSGDVVCSSGNEQPPAGEWNAFARTATEISTDESLTLQPAATLSVAVPDGRRAVAYTPKYAVAYPIDAKQSSVPAGAELWVFIIEKNEPVGVFVVPAIEAGAHRALNARVGAPAAVVGWVQISESDRRAAENAPGVSAPAVQIGGRDAIVSPLSVLNGSFVLAHDVAAGDAELHLGGRGWLPDRTRTKVVNALTPVATPLTARPSSTIIVNWSSSGDLVALNAKIGACTSDERSDARYEITLSSCASVDPASCHVVRREVAPPQPMFGDFTTEELPPGAYRAQVAFGRLPPVSATVTTTPTQIANVYIQARYVEVYGSLTLGGKALADDTLLKFPAGNGFSRRDSGEYIAALIDRFPVLPTDSRVDVVGCSGSPKAAVLTDQALRRGGRLDLDIPDNELAIKVTDTFTHASINNATIRYALMSLSQPKRPVMTGVAQMPQEGPWRMAFVPDREIRISVTAPHYQKAEVPPFSMSKTEKKSIDVQLVPLRGTVARIVSSTQFENGTLMWFGSSGEVTDTTEIAPDGTFMDSGTNDGKMMAVVSFSHPLWMTRMPPTSRRESIEIPFPNVDARTFDVSLKSGDARISRYIGLSIGGVHVPPAALQLHQTLRNLTWLLRGGGPLRIADIAETGAIEVLLGPNIEEVATRARAMDLFTLPQFAGVPRKPLAPGARAVTFD